jgi:hypothetical protein
MRVSTAAAVSPGPTWSLIACFFPVMMAVKRIWSASRAERMASLAVVADAADCPNRRRAGERVFPVLADRFDVAQVHQHPVLNGLGTGVRIDRFAKQVFVCHSSCRSAYGACVTQHDFIAYCRLAISPTSESQSGGWSAEEVSRCRTNEGEAEYFRVVGAIIPSSALLTDP